MTHSTTPVSRVEFSDWSKLRSYLDSEYSQPGWVFRGEAACFPAVKPAIDRCLGQAEVSLSARLKFEQDCMLRFVQDAAMHLDDIQRAILRQFMQGQIVMRHYGAPTRLLDWSQSAWIALYFACEDRLEEPGRVLTLGSGALERTVGARFPVEAGAHATLSFNQGGWAFPKLLSAQFAASAHDWVVCYYRHEEKFPRLVAQQGLFTIASKPDLDHWRVAHQLAPAACQELLIHPALKREAMHHLDRMGITAASLFPGVEGVARRLTCDGRVWFGA